MQETTRQPGSPTQHLLLRVTRSILAALAVALPVIVLIPLQLYLPNAFDFSTSIAALLPDLMPAMLLVAAALALLVVAAPGRWHPRLVVVMVGLAVALWVQGQILVWDYGVLDGSVPNWSEFRLAAVADTLAWVLIAAATIVFRKPIFRLSVPIAAALIVIQAVPVALDLNDPQPLPEFHRYSFDESHKFSFSPDKNVIVVVLDAFQSDIFQSILLDAPQIAGDFQGFTYFRNALAGYAKTYPTIALMLSGKWYENAIPIQDFIKQSLSKQSLPGALKAQGWRVDLFPHVKRIVRVSPALASNVEPVVDCATARSEAGWLLDLGFFRVSPHWLKPFWINRYDWRFAKYYPAFRRCEDPQSLAGSTAVASDSPHAAVRFVEDARELTRANIAAPTFKFYHLMIPHAPFNLDENLAISELPRGPEGFLRQSRSAVEVVRRFLDSLKQADVYDQSMILVLSDHGGGEYIDRVQTGLVQNQTGPAQTDSDPIPGKHLASGLPLVLIKRQGETGELKISDTPVSLGDIAATIAARLELDGNYPGRDIYAMKPDAQRARRYLFLEFGGWRSRYLPELVEYEVDGFSWNPDNWRATGRVFAAPVQQQAAPLIEVPAGDVIGFRPASRYAAILKQGWSEPQTNGLVWSKKRTASMELTVLGDLGPAPVARFDIMPYLARGALAAARIRVTVNKKYTTTWKADKRGWQTLELPAEVMDEGRLVFDFEFLDADAPINHGYSLDRRLLGMALYRLQIAAGDRGDGRKDE